MRVWVGLSVVAFFVFSLSLSTTGLAQNAAPHLEKRGDITQLVVDGKPFLMLGGELHNSSSSSLEYMAPIWPKLTAMHLNTVLTPVSWELVEPEEGRFDFALVDGLIAQARENRQRIVFLWLASWKNGLSSYPPVWVKRDTKRFPRVMIDGKETTILSPATAALRAADAKAFVQLMGHIRQVDGQHTVLMMQVENEVGVLGAARDHSPAADKLYAGPVPAELTAYLSAHHKTLYPELLQLWEQNGARTSGTWEQLFGTGNRTDEIFMAWQYARFAHEIAAAGKAAYPIPMYVNCWLGGGDSKPGDYPSGGPQPRVVDIWKAAGSALDVYSPDLYAADFSGWAERYHREGNPLFIPETNTGTGGASGAFYAFGEDQALGISPFGIDNGLNAGAVPFTPPAAAAGAQGAPRNDPNEFSSAYLTIEQLSPLLLATTKAGMMHGFQLDKDHPSAQYEMNGYTVEVSLDQIFGRKTERGYGLIISTGADSFIGAGKGFRVGFKASKPGDPNVGLASVEEGTYKDGQFVSQRRLNGDENDQGQYWRFEQRNIHIERATIYRFQ